jgi:hypothetical protein
MNKIYDLFSSELGIDRERLFRIAEQVYNVVSAAGNMDKREIDTIKRVYRMRKSMNELDYTVMVWLTVKVLFNIGMIDPFTERDIAEHEGSKE